MVKTILLNFSINVQIIILVIKINQQREEEEIKKRTKIQLFYLFILVRSLFFS